MIFQKRIRKPNNLPNCNQYDDFKKAVKPMLLKMTQFHCSYCDKYFWDEGDLEIDHFKAQSQFPKLKCVWTNLFAACPICNKRKRLEYSKNTKPIRPDEKGYEFDKYFIFNLDTGELEPIFDLSRVNETIDYLQLNNPSLCLARKRFYFDMENHKHAFPNVCFRFVF